jgi:DNA-binding transcriptional MerR regulator
MSKSPEAFRTIREVADWLGVAAHVLRFWESKFSQIRPVKRAGGRRYYRPSDMELVGGIKVLLHDRGMTVRGVQRLLREEGVAAVAALSPPLDRVEGPGEQVVDGIAEETAWRDDALADAREVEGEGAPSLPGFDGAASGGDAPAAEGPGGRPEQVEAPEPDAATGIPAPAVREEPEPEAAKADAEADAPGMAARGAAEEAPGTAGPPPMPGPDPEAAPHRPDRPAGTPAPHGGLDRLAAFAAQAKALPPDRRRRLAPAIDALRQLKQRVSQPVAAIGS